MEVRTVWRLSQKTYADTAFTGEGARRHGGRFNRRGTPVVYTAETLALALVEVLVNLTDYDDLRRFVFFRVDLPADDVETLAAEALPDDWDARPPGDAARELGDAWCREQRTLALAVPSVVVPYSNNVMLNPEHPSMRSVQIHDPESFPVDERLIRV